MNEYKRRSDYPYLHEDMEAPSPASIELIDDLLDAETLPMEMTLPQEEVDRIAIREYLYWKIDFLDEDNKMARELSAKHSVPTPPEFTTSTVDMLYLGTQARGPVTILELIRRVRLLKVHTAWTMERLKCTLALRRSHDIIGIGEAQDTSEKCVRPREVEANFQRQRKAYRMMR
ncbi:unnamed protein product [Zymoseptoria tritici ST99CH_1A5]|uniref:Uncharacterized protein n=1 Tax=Zymoseptoria tritici ST99CH_1A5 TaxID=1276529 RepID=A0A1Y6LPU3_ZYMTR|nr:unnamed protein product [Zymoseptoria tritici ST99CH_1A5]